MAGRGWRVVRLSEIPSPDELPLDDGVTDEEREAARAELRDDIGKQPAFPGYPGFGSARWRAIRPYLGITAFGVAATEASEGEALLHPHTEAQYGHEEIMVGGTPGSYEPPIWARDWRPPEDWLAARRGGG